MALKRVYTGEMVSLSAPWAQKDHADRLLFLSIPVTAALLPQIDDAHQSLLDVQPKAVLSDRSTAIVEEQRILDVRHDNIIRGCSGVLGALVYLTKDPQLVKELVHLQEVLTPDGLTATQKTYRDESGQAALLESRLSPAHISLLKKIKTTDGTLWDAVKEWIEIGAKLGKLEDERTGIKEATGPAPAEVVAARNKWIRTVNAVRTVLALVEADQPGVQTILNRLAETERKADRRAPLAADSPAVVADPVATPAAGVSGGISSGG